MRRILIALIAIAALAPGVATADAPEHACGPLTCGGNGRHAGACTGVITREAAAISLAPTGILFIEDEVTCEQWCSVTGTGSSACVWAPRPSDPLAEPGCSTSGWQTFSINVPVPASGCNTTTARSTITAWDAADPLARVADENTFTVEVCADA